MKEKEEELEKCYLCGRRLKGIEFEKCWVFLCDYEIHFCKKCYTKVLSVLKELKRDYPQIKEFGKSQGKYWHLFCKIQEWAVLEYLLNEKEKRWEGFKHGEKNKS